MTPRSWAVVPFILTTACTAGIVTDGQHSVVDGEIPWGANRLTTDGLAIEHGDRYIVVYNDRDGASRALVSAGAELLMPLLPQNAVGARIPEQALRGLRHNPHIQFIEPDHPRYPMGDALPQPGQEVSPYGIAMVQADLMPMPALGQTSAKKVCIIDSGILASHEDFQGSHIDGTSLVAGEPWNTETAGHGTHVAGTIAAIGGNSTGVVGVLSNGIELYIVKVFNNAGDGASTSTILAGVNACVDAGADVISMSLGGGGKNRTADRTYKSAFDAGILIIAAAGNDGNRAKSYPASYTHVMSVAAVDQNSEIADFSQFNRDVEIAGPGVSTLSTIPWSDVSSATVAGTAYQASRIENSGGAGLNQVTAALIDGGLCASADSTSAWSGKVVLCERGDYTFEEKVLSATNGGAAGVIIYNNVPGGFSAFMPVQASATPPGLSISQADGQALLSQFGQNAAISSVVIKPDNGYALFSGTSMATPHVAAVAALVWSNSPSSDNNAIRTALNATATDLGAPGRDDYFGNGLVQAYAAWQSLAPGCAIDADCDNSDVCDGAESCIGGSCMPGTDLDCADGNACTTDSCDPVAGCANNGVADGSSCSDGAACNGDETCQAGTCSAGIALAAGTDCGDSNVCNGGESCDGSGVCATGSTLDCGSQSCDPTDGCYTPPTCLDPGEKCKSNGACCSGACYVGGGRPRCG